MEKKIERLLFVDIAKGIGIIAVLYAHAGGVYWNKWIQPYYMPMFFFLSGIIFSYLRKSVDDIFILVKRLCRSYFYYSVVIILLYIPLFLIGGEDGNFLLKNTIGIIYSRKAIFYPLEKENNITLMDIGNGPMWFLTCMVISWICFGFLYKTYKKNYLVSIIVVFIYIELSVLLTYLPILLPWSIDTAFVGGIFIFWGVVFEETSIYFGKCKKYHSLFFIYYLLMFIAFLMIYNILYSRVSIQWNMSVRDYSSTARCPVLFFMFYSLLGISMMLFLCKILQNLPVLNILLGYIGRHSLEIMCLHMIVYKYLELFNNYVDLHHFLFDKHIKVAVALGLCIIPWGEYLKSLLNTNLIKR